MTTISTCITKKARPLERYQSPLTTEQISQKLGLKVNEVLKLDSSENQFVQEQRIPTIVPTLYPDANATDLINALSEYLKIPTTWIAVGNGSDELIDLLCAVFLDPGDTLLDVSPSFPMYQQFAKIRNARVKKIKLKKDFSLDLPNTVAALKDAQLLFIANPNNPTGTVTPNTIIEKILKVGKPVVVDEAYFEYSQTSVAALLSTYDNLMILRTFSKWAGLAGLRIGYVMANPSVIAAINAIKPPYNTNSIAQLMAAQALNDTSLFKSIEKQIELRNWFISELQTIPQLTVTPSRTNFVFIKSKTTPANEIVSYLQQKGILVRLISTPELTGIRIGLCDKPQLKKISTYIQEVV